jgi:hypothetical protein
MPREENKSSNDAQAKAAEKLPSIPEAVPADSAPGPAQTAAPNKPERSSGKQSKRRRWLLKAGAVRHWRLPCISPYRRRCGPSTPFQPMTHTSRPRDFRRLPCRRTGHEGNGRGQ